MRKTKSIAPKFMCAILLAGAGGGFAAHAQSGYGKTDATESKTRSDEEFVKDAASGGMAEVKLGQLAQEKGTAEAVKNFGSRMVNDHSKAADRLKAAAGESNIQVPDKLNAKDEALYNRLSKMSGAAFDREYAKEMVTDHTHDVSEFRKEALDGRDRAIQAFASQTLPTLQDHLKQAREMEKEVSGSASAHSKVNNSY
jgi:putative membrane protein